MNKEENVKKKSKLSKLREAWKDKRGRAKIELSLYFIFFLVVVVFTRVGSNSINNQNITTNNEDSFINSIKDNYEYNMNITIDDNIYTYKGKVLGNNASIERQSGEEVKYFYIMQNKYYELDSNGNYILTTSDEVYPYIHYNYLNISNIKNFINNGIKEDNKYIVKISNIILNNTSNDNITISIDEENMGINIDYTNILRIDSDISNAIVNIAFTNINNIMSLEE